MAKTAPTVTSSVQATGPLTEARINNFVNEQHRGHEVTLVGHYIQRGESVPHEVRYCARDNELLIA